jgi:hypothetical protein
MNDLIKNSKNLNSLLYNEFYQFLLNMKFDNELDEFDFCFYMMNKNVERFNKWYLKYFNDDYMVGKYKVGNFWKYLIMVKFHSF